MDADALRDWRLALSHMDAGNLVAAAAVCEAMLANDSAAASANWLLTSISLAQGRFRRAVGYARSAADKASELAPAQATAVTRGLIAVGEYSSALAILRHMASHPPKDGRALAGIAEQLTMLEQHDAALACLDFAQQMGVRHPLLSFLRGSAFRAKGDFAAAARAMEEAVVRDPLYGHAHWALASLGELSGCGRRIDRLRKALTADLGQGHPASETPPAVLLGYALYKELERLGEYAGAWAALSQAMSLQRRHSPHDQARENALFDHLIETYTSDFTIPRGAWPIGASTPIFIVGMPRTGTTLLERILGNHADVAACGELNDLQMQFRWETDHVSSDIISPQGAKAIEGVDAEAFGRGYQERTRPLVHGRPWFSDKHQANFVFCGLILRAMPGARVIHLHREPLDACFSNLKELFSSHVYSYSYSLEDVANHWNNYTRLMRHVEEAAPGRMLHVDYERLALDPEAQAQRILSYCGLPLREGLTDIQANTAPVTSASTMQVREPIHGGHIGGWKKYADQLAPLRDLIQY